VDRLPTRDAACSLAAPLTPCPALPSALHPILPPSLPPSLPFSQACLRKIDPEDIEVDVDAIDNQTFWVVDVFVKDCLPGGKKATKKGTKQGAGAAPASAGGESRAKKARTG
jgi:hypothetical protein